MRHDCHRVSRHCDRASVCRYMDIELGVVVAVDNWRPPRSTTGIRQKVHLHLHVFIVFLATRRTIRRTPRWRQLLSQRDDSGRRRQMCTELPPLWNGSLGRTVRIVRSVMTERQRSRRGMVVARRPRTFPCRQRWRCHGCSAKRGGGRRGRDVRRLHRDLAPGWWSRWRCHRGTRRGWRMR